MDREFILSATLALFVGCFVGCHCEWMALVVPAALGALVFYCVGLNPWIGIGVGVLSAVALLFLCVGCKRWCKELGEIREFCSESRRKHNVAQPSQNVDVESPNFRIMSLNSEQDSIVCSSLAGEEIFRISRPVEMQSGVLLAEVAEALRTENARVSLYENGRTLDNFHQIHDLSLITVRQVLGPEDISAVKPKTTVGTEASHSSIANEQGTPTVQIMAPAAGTLLQSPTDYSFVGNKTAPASHVDSNSALSAHSVVTENGFFTVGPSIQVERATETMPRATDVLPQPVGYPQPPRV